MKTITLNLLTIILLLTVNQCARKTVPAAPEPEPPDMHTGQIALDWAGTYHGTIPCADCPGIETTLTLNADQTYRLSSLYIDRTPEPFIDQGRFEWQPDGNTIVLKNTENEERKIKVEENQLVMLNSEGKEAEGELADFYILTKKEKLAATSPMEKRLAQNDWQFTEVNGEAINEESTLETPFIRFTPAGKRINGNAGCNLFFGSYTLQADASLKLSKIGATKRYCRGVTVEADILEALNAATRLKLNGDTTLIFFNEQDEPILKMKSRRPDEQ